MSGLPGAVQTAHGEKASNLLSLPPKSKSPNRAPSRRLSSVVDVANDERPGRSTKNLSNASRVHERALKEIQPTQLGEWKELLPDAQHEKISPRYSIWCLIHILGFVF